MTQHDFRKGGWGHAMHGATWRVLPDRIEKRGWFRKPVAHPRSSVMVHVSPGPRVGDEVIYTGESRFDRIARVAEVKWTGNVWDMFTLTLEDFRSFEPAPTERETA